MRILMVTNEFPPGPGGIGTHIFQLALQLNDLGNDICVLGLQDYAAPAEIQSFNRVQKFQVIPLPRFPLPVYEGLLRYQKLRNTIQQFHPDVVMATGSRSVWVVAAMLRNSSIPWLAIGHGTEFGEKDNLEQKISRWAYSRARQVVCVSHYTQTRMEMAGIRPHKTQVIHNGADAVLFSQEPIDNEAYKKSLGLENRFILLTVGNVTPRKGQEVVIRALPQIARVIPEVMYLMAGLPTFQQPLLELAGQLGVLGNLRFLGKVDPEHLVRLYYLCDLFLMTSQHTPDGDFEGFGIAVIEAALAGKPAIVSAGSGLAEAVMDGITGKIVRVSDPVSSAQAVIDLYQSPSLRSEMGRHAKDRAVGEFTWQSVGQKYLGILHEMMTRP